MVDLATITPDYDHPALGRAHIRAWGEDGPEVVVGEQCSYCGHTGGHAVITLGRVETQAIVTPMLRDLGAMRRTTT